MTQPEKASATKTGDLNSIPGAHREEREVTLSKLSSDLHIEPCHTSYPNEYINTILKFKKSFKEQLGKHR